MSLCYLKKIYIIVFTSLSCKHTLKLSFAQHCPSAVGWWVRIMSVLVCGRPGDSQSKGHLPQQSFWLKTCAWLSTLTHFWSLNFRWFPSPSRRMKNHTGKLLSLTAMRLHRERKSSSQICSVLSISDQRPRCELISHLITQVYWRLHCLRLFITQKRISRNLLIVNPVQFNQDYINLILVSLSDWKICIT